MNISKINREPLSLIVYENIKTAIINGEIKPGTRLTETKLSKQLDVSPTPVREAFRRLASEGLVKIIPYKGAVVQEYSSQELQEVYQCREALEIKAIELSIEQITPKQLTNLRDLIEKSKNTASHTEYVEINTMFHDIIISSAKNSILTRLLNQINDVVIHNRTVSAYSDERKLQIINEHTNIYTALENADKDKAVQAMKTHIRNGYDYIKTHTIK